jgi:hypothetical protein
MGPVGIAEAAEARIDNAVREQQPRPLPAAINYVRGFVLP